jgi:formyltetrahydrofolate deformylase
MATRNSVDAPDTAVNGRHPSREALPVNDVGRLLLRCADRPGLVAAVSTFLAQAGANIVSLDQHSTEQSGGTFMQRTIFHLPGLPAAYDTLERDFGAQVATQFQMHYRLARQPSPNEWRSWRPRTTIA